MTRRITYSTSGVATDSVPTAIAGDMDSINKANFAILHWRHPRLAPRSEGRR